MVIVRRKEKSSIWR